MTIIDKGGAEHLAGEARDEVGKFIDEVLDLLSGARDRGQEDLAELRERVQGSAQRLKEGALKSQAELRAVAESAAAKADDYAHENPWHVAALAAALGLALGVLLSRR